MSANPFLKRVLGEAAPPSMDLENTTAPIDDVVPDEPEAPAAPASTSATANVPAQSLARMWQAGQQMDVATQLMFTPASYIMFVDLCFLIGQADARRLGQLLDELADSENIPVPQPSTEYSSILQNVAKRNRSNVPPRI